MANNKRGPERGSQKAKNGGEAVRQKYGPEFYSKIGKKGGERGRLTDEEDDSEGKEL